MDYPNSIINHTKNKHLRLCHRVIIELRLKDGYSAYKIAKELGCASNTIRNEIRRGTVIQIRQGKHVSIYFADAGQRNYQANRKHSVRKFKRLQATNFINYVIKKMRSRSWSIDACVGESIVQNRFNRSERVCTKTLYNYVDLGLLPIKNVDLPQKLRRNTKSARVQKNKRKLGKSITERAQDIETREEFGHWEIDTVIGKKSKEDAVLLTLSERKTRQYITRKIAGKTTFSVMAAIADLQEEYGERFSDVFKTITSDNGQEFADLSLLEKDTETKVYFTHPYSSFERGTNERHNGLLRRFIPKGHPIADYSIDEIAFVEDWCNHLPRKILGYSTPAEQFEKYLDQIYAV
jgi:IS30 family transposase